MSESNRKLVSIPPENMDVNSLISWFGKQFATSAELFQEAEQYYSDLKKHHQNLSELMGVLNDLKAQSNPPREEIDQVVDTASEVIEAIQAITSNSYLTDQQLKDVDELEEDFVATDEGKTAQAELQSDIDRFLKNYNAFKIKLGLETQKDVANLTGIDRRYISIIENGKHKPQFKTLKRLAAAFGVEVDQLTS